MSTGIIIMERRNKVFVCLQVLLLWKLRKLTLERKIITFKI